MSISTGTGDQGETGLLGGQRLPKDDLRLEAYGTVDELSATIGLLRTHSWSAQVDDELTTICSWLLRLGSDLAQPGAGVDPNKKALLDPACSDQLTDWVHREEGSLPPLRSFILPGGTETAALCHLARTVCRRAERRVVTLQRDRGEGAAAVVFLNRLSDLLFLYARRANHDAGIADTERHP